MRNEKNFNKVLSASDVLVTAFGAMIGWGWVISSGEWIRTAGVLGTVIGFIIGGVMIYFVGLTYAELTTAMPLCGGEHIFSYKAFGAFGAFVCTWAIILSYIGVVCFETCSLPTIVQYVFPNFLQGYLYTVAGFDIYASWLIVAICVAILITYVNIRGVKAAAMLQSVLTISIAGVGILLVGASVVHGDVTNLNNQLFGENNLRDLIKQTLSVAVIAPFFLFGFDVIPQVAEEINVPLKKLGKILILSILLAVTFYSLVVFSVGYAMNSQEIAEAIGKSSLVTAEAMEKVFGSSTMAKVLIIGGMCGIITSWNSFLIGGSRAMYSMAESYMIPHTFTKLHEIYKTPINTLLLIGGLSVIAPFWGRAMLGWISNVASFACCIAYCMVAISFLVIRKKEPELERPYRVKRYRVVGVLAVLMSGVLIALYIFPNTGSTLSVQEWCIAGGWALIGIGFAVVCKIKYKSYFGMCIDMKNEREDER